MVEYEKKLEDLKESKTWVTDEERKDVTDRMSEIQTWLQEQLDKQAKLSLFQDPVFNSSEVVKKMQQLKKLYNKVANKRKPKPPKEEKKEKKEKEEEVSDEDFADAEQENKENKADSENSETEGDL